MSKKRPKVFIRSRKLRLSPVQREIVWMLEEAGAEEIPTVLYTLMTTLPDCSPDEVVAAVEEAVRGLCDLGLVVFGRDYEAPGLHYVQIPADEAGPLLAIHEYMGRDARTGTWEWGTLPG